MNSFFNRIAVEMSSRQLLVPLDVLLVGATGVGKSSTINAIFGSEQAKVGTGCDPETQNIAAYRVHDYFRVHDSAGLGDGKSNDASHAKNIMSELMRKASVKGDPSPYGFIDLVMVILDGSSRDMGTTYQLLQDTILPFFDPKRIIVVINQADMAMKGRYWDYARKTPEQKLVEFLDEKVSSIQLRLHEATGVKIRKPVYYSAYHQYNLEKVMQLVIDALPTKRRLIQVSEQGKVLFG